MSICDKINDCDANGSKVGVNLTGRTQGHAAGIYPKAPRESICWTCWEKGSGGGRRREGDINCPNWWGLGKEVKTWRSGGERGWLQGGGKVKRRPWAILAWRILSISTGWRKGASGVNTLPYFIAQEKRWCTLGRSTELAAAKKRRG